jgi:hypothetical protein
MTQAITQYPTDNFPAPAATSPTKPILTGNYAANNQIHTILYYVNKNDPTGPDPSNPASDPQFKNWETGVINWAKQNIPNFTTEYNQ